jgi:hypothetical protein
MHRMHRLVGQDAHSITREHLWELARKLHPNGSVKQKAWMKKYQRRLLDKGKIEELVLNPLMASSSRFLLSWQMQGTDGLLHTSPSNAHETQWDVTDPTTDIAAARALFPAMIEEIRVLSPNQESE